MLWNNVFGDEKVTEKQWKWGLMRIYQNGDLSCFADYC